MVDTLYDKTRVPASKKKVLVCFDAGVATEQNLLKVQEKGYNYLCVGRLLQKYPSIAKYYVVDYTVDNKTGNATLPMTSTHDCNTRKCHSEKSR